jgi:hypothetical protein
MKRRPVWLTSVRLALWRSYWNEHYPAGLVPALKPVSPPIEIVYRAVSTRDTDIDVYEKRPKRLMVPHIDWPFRRSRAGRRRTPGPWDQEARPERQCAEIV